MFRCCLPTSSWVFGVYTLEYSPSEGLLRDVLLKLSWSFVVTGILKRGSIGIYSYPRSKLLAPPERKIWVTNRKCQTVNPHPPGNSAGVLFGDGEWKRDLFTQWLLVTNPTFGGIEKVHGFESPGFSPVRRPYNATLRPHWRRSWTLGAIPGSFLLGRYFLFWDVYWFHILLKVI